MEIYIKINIPSVRSLSIANNCLVSSKVELVACLGKGTGLWANCAPGALLCELFEPIDDVEADSETSLLPF